MSVSRRRTYNVHRKGSNNGRWVSAIVAMPRRPSLAAPIKSSNAPQICAVAGFYSCWTSALTYFVCSAVIAGPSGLSAACFTFKMSAFFSVSVNAE